MLISQPDHDMQMLDIDTAGAEEWYCPTCHRRLMVSWSPGFSREVLEPGDEWAVHRGSYGGLRLSFPQLHDPQE